MTLWHALFAGLVALTAIGLLIPIARHRSGGAPGRAEAELALQRSRLEQVNQDREHGLITDEEAAESEAEIGRAVLRAAREADAAAERAPMNGGVWPVATMTVLVMAVGIAIYTQIGRFGLMDQPLTARNLPATGMPTLAGEHEGTEIQSAIASLRERLKDDPANAENWELLARSYTAVSAHAEAAEAYRKLIDLVPFDLEIRGNYAEELIRAADGLVGPAAVEAFEIVLAHEPKDPRARYYVALGHAQAGRDREAAEGWAAILRDAPPDAPYLTAIRRILDALIEDAGIDRASLDLPAEAPAAMTEGRGPTAADMAAAADMTDDERETMIRGMVARLEERLAAEPEDVEGWLRLARSRMVLGDRDAAIAALEKGLAANPDAPALVGALAELKGG